LIFDKSPHAPELAQAVEVAHKSHVRVGGLLRSPLGVKVLPCRGEHDGIAAYGDRAECPARSANANIEPPRRLFGVEHLGEEVVAVGDPARREEAHGSSEERLNLLAR